MLDRERIVSQLNSNRFAVMVMEQTDSTNTALREMAQYGATEGVTLIADTQSGGRGRRGRTFASPQGGLYLSTLLRPQGDADPGVITCRAAVAAARAIESLCDLNVEIKWVNDLFVAGRKVAGILAEGVLSPEGTLTAVVLGIGINVAGTLPPELRDIATTLADQGVSLTREDLAAAFLNGLAHTLCADAEEMMEESRRRSLVLGRTVTVVRGNDTFTATARAITDRGHLVVDTAAGEITLTSGEVSLRL